ncbi:MAG: double zinc ribbon domain-containing protein [Candidatus Hodarchaeales archaeon]|jgi:predicted RNA-binding Zn-ribbon protein involved in translation (DUF1610 family)
MKCSDCGSENPKNATYCYQCGAELSLVSKKEYSHTQKTFQCPQCGVQNPDKAKYCYNCGSLQQETFKQQPTTCQTCGFEVDQSRQYCPNCSQSLIKEQSTTKTKITPVPSIKTHIVCPACGQTTTGDYCRNCGYNLTVLEYIEPLDYWYCSRDSAVMNEIDPNLQIRVSRKNPDESLAQALSQQVLQVHNREKARGLAQQLLEESGTNFVVLTQVKCPVCGQQSIASATHRPVPSRRLRYPVQITLNASNILRNGFFYFKTYPRLLLILLSAILIDSAIIFIGLSPLSILDPTSFLLGSGLSVFPYNSATDLLSLLLLSSVLSVFANNFIQCWYYTSLKQIRSGSGDFNIIESFKSNFRFFFKAIVAQITIVVIIFALVVGILFLAMLFVSLGSISYSAVYLVILIFVIVIAFGSLILGFLISVLFAYVNMSIVFENNGIILSLKRSWRFARTYFWTTVGVIAIFSFLPGILGIFLSPGYVLFGFTQAYLIVSGIPGRLVEAYKSISMGWGFDEFKQFVP